MPHYMLAAHSREGEANQANQKLDELYAEIGRLTTQVNWLKKKSGLEFIEK